MSPKAKLPKKGQPRRKNARLAKKAIKWCVGLAIVALLGYGISQMSGVAYGADDIKVVDFSSLRPDQQTTALKAANQARCVCGCGMTLAQCVATDSTCPVREGNIGRIRKMVEAAAQ
jgi:hypothetical protein